MELINTPLFSDSDIFGYWQFEGSGEETVGGTTTSDNNMTFTTGKYGQAGVFNGTSSYIDTGLLFRTLDAPFTVAAWVNPDTVSSDQNIFGQIAGTFPSDMKGFEFQINSASKLSLQLWNANNNGSSASTGTLTTGIWQHVAVSYDDTNVKFYINGALDSTVANATGIKTAGSDQMGAIGRRTWSSTGLYYDGMIDDFCAFERVLTDAEVLLLASDPAAGFFYMSV